MSRQANKQHSFALLALFAYLVLDSAARFSYKHWSIDRYNSPNRSYIWWTVKDFRSQASSPDIVLMGSSLLLTGLHGSDATFLGLPLNNVFHHRSYLLESLLERKLKKKSRTFAFAIGGLMASDAYLVSSLFTHGSSKVKTLIYGIAPRDLMDNAVSATASTETFHYFSKFNDLSPLAMRARPSFWDRLDFHLSQLSFLYAHKADFAYLQHHYANTLCKRYSWFSDLEFVKTPYALREIAMFQLPEDVGPNEMFTYPFSPGGYKFFDNTSEYHAHYVPFRRKLFDDQVSYLAEIMSICRSEGIELILVNMPLTSENISLMPPGFYDVYMSTINRLCAQNNFRFIDMQKMTLSHGDFQDSVHLNGQGGIKFFTELAASVR